MGSVSHSYTGIFNRLQLMHSSARATSAAPRIFKPFHHEGSKQTYLDGAVYHNNPVGIADSEWRLIWGSNLCSHPDVVLSLGTGFDPQKRERLQRNPDL